MSDSSDKILERIVASEKVLAEIKQGKHKHFQLFVFGAVLGVRKISDTEKFKDLGPSSPEGNEGLLSQLIDGSQPELYVLTSYREGSPYFHVFGTEEAITSSDSFLASCIQAIVERTYKAVGIDPGEIEEDSVTGDWEDDDELLDH